MTENAVLLVPHPALLPMKAGGLTVLERQLWTLRRAGIGRVWVGAQAPSEALLRLLRLPPGLEIIWSSSPSAAELQCAPPYLALSGDHFIRVETLKYIAGSDYPASVTLEDAAGTAVVQVVAERRDRVTGIHRQPLPAGSTRRLESRTLSDAHRWLLSAGTKGEDGFMARNFDRNISLAISSALLETPVTPNMMTILSSAIGLAGAAFFLVPTHGMRLAGALLVWLHSVLDGCDGELARIRFQESPLGADLDFWGDNVVHVALFGCLSYGFYKADHSLLPLILGAAAAVGTAGSAALNYLERLERRRRPVASDAAHAAGLVPALTRIENMLAARDFIYLLVVLAYLDRLYEFMWASAIGSLLFFFMMLYLGRSKKNEQATQPHPPGKGQTGNPPSGNGGGHQHLYSRS